MSKKNYDYLIGKRFHRLTVQEIVYVKNSHTRAKCLCECGNEITTQIQYLLNGHTKSCGCYRKEFGVKIRKAKPICNFQLLMTISGNMLKIL